MDWDLTDAAAYGGNGATAVKTDGGWEAYPFGIDAGSAGCFPDRGRAIAVIETIVADGTCLGCPAEDM